MAQELIRHGIEVLTMDEVRERKEEPLTFFAFNECIPTPRRPTWAPTENFPHPTTADLNLDRPEPDWQRKKYFGNRKRRR